MQGLRLQWYRTYHGKKNEIYTCRSRLTIYFFMNSEQNHRWLGMKPTSSLLPDVSPLLLKKFHQNIFFLFIDYAYSRCYRLITGLK